MAEKLKMKKKKIKKIKWKTVGDKKIKKNKSEMNTQVYLVSSQCCHAVGFKYSNYI